MGVPTAAVKYWGEEGFAAVAQHFARPGGVGGYGTLKGYLAPAPLGRAAFYDPAVFGQTDQLTTCPEAATVGTVNVKGYIELFRNAGGDITPQHPDYDEYAEMGAIEDWIADGCPPIDGVTVSEADRQLLLAQPLTIAQVARREQVDPRTVRRWLAKGELEGAYKIGARNWRIPVEAVDGRRVRASQPKPQTPIHKRRPRRTKISREGGSWLS